MAESPSLECPCCGHVLAVPAEVSDDALCACAHCGMVLRNCTGSRAFRWALVDPYVRRHGVSRANLWGGMLGALVWLPVLAIVMAVTGKFDIALLLALAGPYLILLAFMRKRRAATPALVWTMELWIGFGLYLLYLGLLHALLPQRLEVVFSAGGVGMLTIFVLGGAWVAFGLCGRAWYRGRAARLPQLLGTPPRE